jgi:quinol-cytochrome oxidoreductase complex cytochrome b subunit
VPRDTASWFYVFGSATFVIMVLQFVTGILLAMVYVPTPGEAWQSLQALNGQIAFGWFLRAVHGWGSNFMVALLLIHMTQVFLFGAFKYPRELTWMIGVGLLLLTLGMAFTGQIMRFDADAYWGLGIGASVSARVPFVGSWLVGLLLGGPIIAGQTLSRFFTLHVFVVPGLLIGAALVHVLLVVKVGINEWPMPGRLVSRKTYLTRYRRLVHEDGVAFVPDAFQRDLVFSALIILAVLVCAAVFGPFGPSGRPDPRMIDIAPKPDVFFLWLYAALALLPAELETALILIVPGSDRGTAAPAVHFRHRRKELEAAAVRSARGSAPRQRLHRAHVARPPATLVALHDRLEWNAIAAPAAERANAARAPGRPGVSEQAVSELPCPRRDWRRPGTPARQRRRAFDQGSTDPAGAPGQRRDAGVR